MAEKTVAIIGARLNSSRLPGKHLLDLAGKPLIARLVDRLRRTRHIDQLILATTEDAYNQPLVDWAEDYGVPCLAYAGDVNDLMGRVDAAVAKSGADIIVYICGDSPLIDPDTLDSLVTGLKAAAESDTVILEAPPNGKKYIHEGFSIYRRKFWNRMIEASQTDFEREHVGSVYHHFGKVSGVSVAEVKGEPFHYSLDHRLSVDTASDYKFMQILYREWFRDNSAQTIVSLDWVIQRVQSDDHLRAMNVLVRQKKADERSHKVLMLTEAGQAVGFGHLYRSMNMVAILQDRLSVGCELVIKGTEVRNDVLALFPHRFVDSFDVVSLKENEVVVVDLKGDDADVASLVQKSKESDIPVLGIDTSARLFDCDWALVPCHYVDQLTRDRFRDKLLSGWESYLLPEIDRKKSISDQVSRIAVILGSGDAGSLLSLWLPFFSNKRFRPYVFDLYLGMVSDLPSQEVGGNINLIRGVDDLAFKMCGYDIILGRYGVSAFEAISARVPSIIYMPKGEYLCEEVESFKNADVAEVAMTPDEALTKLDFLTQNEQRRKKLFLNTGNIPISDHDAISEFLNSLLSQ